MKKTDVTSTRHILPFGNLSDDDFERLCYWVVEKSSEFDSVEHYGMTGDKRRDVIGYKHSTAGKREQWYFQCKRYKKIFFASFRDELDAIKKHSDDTEDFKPDMVVFVTACGVSPSCKDSVKGYAKTLSLGFVCFWTDVELDEKTKATGTDEEFFKGGINTEALADKFAESVDMRMAMRIQQLSQFAEADSIKTDEVNKEIDEAVKFIHTNNIEEAKSRLFVVLGKVKDKQGKCANELARIYNNLGVCFNRFGWEGGDFDKAEEYFGLALKAKPDFNKSKANLASVFLNRGGKDNFKKAYDIAIPLWEDSDKKESLFFQILIWSIFYYQSSKEAISYYEGSEEAKLLVGHNEQLLNLMGMVYFEVQDFTKAKELVESALELSPNSPQNLSLKARILMGRSQKENVIPSVFEVVPKFRDYQDIKIAMELLDQALEAIKSENNPFFEERIKTDILLCSLWLRRANEAKYRDIRASIDLERLEPQQKLQLKIQDFAVELQARNFETAYNVLVQASEWSKAGYREKFRVAHIFFLRGAPQQSKDILKQLEMEAEQKKEVQFWLDMSLIETLLDNKNLAIKAAERAKDISAGTKMEKSALSHFNALMLRYARSGEVDRLMAGVFDYDKKYPDDKLVKPIKAINDEGKPTEEIKSILLKQKEWYEGIRQKFRSQPAPSYYLEEIFKRPYADILSLQNDPEFIIELTIPNEQFEKELLDNLEEAEQLVFDYASLLNLSKMNLLGHLGKFSKQLYVTEELFNKVQYELLSFEHEDLRRLWNFLRSSKEFDIVEETNAELKSEKVPGLFDKWIIDSMKLAKEKNAVFVTDDLRFLRFLRSEDIKGCNSFLMLRAMVMRKWIDAKVYSTSVGDLAERFYTFLRFTGDDLFQIVMEDKSKITLRSYHLVNQLFLPGSIAASFTGVFVKFIDFLWKTGSLPEDKLQWLTFLTNRILEFIDKQGGVQNKEELEKVVPDFVQIWIIAVKGSNKDEIALIEKKVEEVLNKPYLAVFKDNIGGLIKVAKERQSKG